ncbi:MAG TPA: folylpolyglutamate synthase/dihydrofolate synthase family protein [Prosthecobacter sp.]|nr:folylpolyglutamate synthase/dihydrofolate synthase family protein [Prosthecobacter sp.]
MSAESGSALDWLYGTQLFGIKLGLDNMHRLLRALQLPPAGMKFIHVAGTNGKGSTCAFMHAILKEAGIDAGLFTSPHLIRFNERIQDGRRVISDAEIETGLSRIRAVVRDWQPHPTFFEITFALALDWFRQRGLEWAILETGMGGRLDATNAVLPAVSVITAIGWDHMEYLGSTLGEIAMEKGGIIKRGVPVVTQVQPEEVEQVLRTTAERQGALLTMASPLSGVAPGLAGPHQRQNAALAVEALRAAGLALSAEQTARGLAAVRWPGRFQRVGNVILDGAHNPQAARTLVQTWQEQFPGEKAVVVFAAASNKDVVGMMKVLTPIVKEWRFTAFQSARAVAPESLLATWESLQMPKVPVSTSATVSGALSLGEKTPILAVGSLFLVGEVLSILSGVRGSFEMSAQ